MRTPLARDAGVADLIRQTGYVVAYQKRTSYIGDSIAWKLRRDRGVVVEELDQDGIRALVPQLTGQYEMGLYLPEQGFVANPGRLTKGLAAQFERDGGIILRRQVRDIDVGWDGPRALMTDDGPIPVEKLVICAGSHSNEFTSRLGDSVPLEAERGYHVTYSDPRVMLTMPVFMPEHKFFITPMEMGLRIAGQTEFAGIAADPDYGRADILARHMRRLFPDISTRRYDEMDGTSAVDARFAAGHRAFDAILERLLRFRPRPCRSVRRRAYRPHRCRSRRRTRAEHRRHTVPAGPVP